MPRPATSRAGVLLGVCLTAFALLAVLLPTSAVGSTVAVAARAADPTRDWPALPARCTGAPDQPLSRPGMCVVTRFDRKRPTLVLWGDSHAYHHIPALRRAVGGQNVNLVAFIAGACPPMVPPPNQRDKCSDVNRMALDYIARLRDNGRRVGVLLGAYWHWYLSTLERIDAGEQPEADEAYIFKQSAKFRRGVPRAFRKLGRMRVDVDVIGQVPTVPETVLPCPQGDDPYSCPISRRRALPDERETREYVETRMKDLAGSPRLVNVKPRICDRLLCYGLRDDIHTWYDPMHLSATFSRTIAAVFAGVVRDLKR